MLYEVITLYHHLRRMKDAILLGERDHALLAQQTIEDLTKRGWQVDYVETRNADIV